MVDSDVAWGVVDSSVGWVVVHSNVGWCVVNISERSKESLRK